MNKGDYVLATKYSDGDAGDSYCVGFYDGSFDHFGQTRHLVVDSEGKQFRHNGHRRCEPITADEGRWLIEHFSDFKMFETATDEHGEDVVVGWSLWDWLAYRRSQVSGAREHDSP